MVLVTTILYILGYFAVFARGFVVKKATCPDPWHNVPNPCLQNPQNQIYHPHPSDPTKFLQCDAVQKMYIIQCPQGEIYDKDQATCIAGKVTILINGPNVVTHPASTTPQPTPKPTPQTTQTTTAMPKNANIHNPCTNANLAHGSVYFAHPTDPTKFIQCDLLGKMLIEQCNNSLVWDQNRLSCVYNYQPGVAVVQPTTAAPLASTTIAMGTTTVKNPCTPNAISQDQLFHPYPGHPNKFLQCDLWGDVQVVDCPTNLVWNDVAKTCSASYLALPQVG